jgi:cystathionine beta-synthase
METTSSTGVEISDSILDAVGDTPLVRLSRLGKDLRPQLIAKVEALNPGGSIKDRAAIALIEAAERDGKLKPGGTIVEPTSGNTGTGLAIAAALKGYRVIAVMPDKMSKEKIDLLRAYGAEVVVAPTEVPPESPESYYRVADRLTEEIPGAFQPNQYKNQANPEAHYRTTGPELWRQTGGQITHFVAGVGTGGTITGVGRYLRERKPDIQIIGADPVGSIYSGGEEGVKPYLVEGVGEDFWPDTYDPSVVDRYITVSDRDSFLWTRRLAETEGILAGGSGGLALYAAYQVARELDDPSAMVVVILPDGGRSYLSKVFNDAWMRQYGFLERDQELTVGDVLRRKHAEGEIPPLLTVETHAKVRDAVALLHEHRVSQLPVVSAHDPHTVVGSVSERGLLRHAMDDPALLSAEIVEVMEAPFPAVAAEDGVREAVELLADRREALLVNMDGRAAGIVTRADEAPPRHPRCACGARARSQLRLGHPADSPDLDLRAAEPGRVRRGLRLRALGQPHAHGAGERARRARGRPGVGVLERDGGHARAAHRPLQRGRSRDPAARPLRRHLPAGRQGARAIRDRLRHGRPDGPRRSRARGARGDAVDLGGNADKPAAERRRHRSGDRA